MTKLHKLPASIVQKAEFWFEQLSHRPIEDRMRAALNAVHNDVRQFYDWRDQQMGRPT